jgi:hypothetical protein
MVEAMRRVLPLLAVLATLAACSNGQSVTTQRYYDPAGLFSTRLPAANDLLVMPKQAIEGNAPLLSGVLAIPPQASPSPSTQPFGGGIQPVTQQDTAIYGVFVVRAAGVNSVGDLATTLLTGTMGPNLVSQRLISAGRLQGLLAVVDHHDDTNSANDYTDASAFFLKGRVGYWIRELFPPGQWDQRRDTFMEILRSFRPTVPAGLPGVPLGRPGLEIRSGIGWPLG